VSLLLAPDVVALYPGGGSDSHGWALPDNAAPVWEGPGNLQPVPGRSDAGAADGGGHGPYDPAHGAAAVIYLPPDAPVADGIAAVVRGQGWVLSQARLIEDPAGMDLTCWVATATGVDTWPSGGTDA